MAQRQSGAAGKRRSGQKALSQTPVFGEAPGDLQHPQRAGRVPGKAGAQLGCLGQPGTRAFAELLQPEPRFPV